VGSERGSRVGGFKVAGVEGGGMYAVVGCNECGSLWLLSDPDDAETARCPRCGKRHRTRKLRRFHESEDREAARQARATLLADKRDDLDSFRELESVGEMERRLDDAGIDDREFVEASGLDADAVDAAGDLSGVSSRSRDEVVREALREGGRPTEEEVVAYAEERGVPGEAARDLLAKLTRRGEASESRGRYRLL
jgi:DNA-directed RNA polymerase subunit RPC12/RpoP